MKEAKLTFLERRKVKALLKYLYKIQNEYEQREKNQQYRIDLELAIIELSMIFNIEKVQGQQITQKQIKESSTKELEKIIKEVHEYLERLVN